MSAIHFIHDGGIELIYTNKVAFLKHNLVSELRHCYISSICNLSPNIRLIVRAI